MREMIGMAALILAVGLGTLLINVGMKGCSRSARQDYLQREDADNKKWKEEEAHREKVLDEMRARERWNKEK